MTKTFLVAFRSAMPRVTVGLMGGGGELLFFVSKYLVKSSSASLLWPYLHFEVVKIVVKKNSKKKT